MIDKNSSVKPSVSSKFPVWLALTIGFASLAFVLFLIAFFVINRWSVDLTVHGEAAQTIEYGNSYEEPGAEATLHGSLICKKGYPLSVQITGVPSENELGNYTITYEAGLLFWKATEERHISIVDTIPPEIQLVEVPDLFVAPGQQYVEPGFTATDLHDGDLTDQVKVVEREGSVKYTVTDSSGNTATAVRPIFRTDPSGPEITLKGDKKMTIPAGSTFEEPGFTAIDNVDGEMTNQVTVTGSVNPFHADTYTLKYSATDAAGNETVVKRTVVVEPLRQEDDPTADSKIVYLTYDDGPSAYTRQLLDVLAAYNVKATFFTCNTPYKSLIKDEYEEGHSIAIHTASHDYKKIYSSSSAFYKDVQKQADLIYQYTGEYPSMIRFPGGSSNTVSAKYCKGIMTSLTKSVLEKGYQYFDWNVLSGDAGETESTDQVVKNVIDGIQSHDVSIVLQHDIADFSVNAVERILIWGIQNGYTFLPLHMDSFASHMHVFN